MTGPFRNEQWAKDHGLEFQYDQQVAMAMSENRTMRDAFERLVKDQLHDLYDPEKVDGIWHYFEQDILGTRDNYNRAMTKLLAKHWP